MNLKITDDFVQICKAIVKANKTIEEWCEIESDDMFQAGTYCGGFDADEREFCFEVIIDDSEYWFQFSLEQAVLIAGGKTTNIDIRQAE